MPTDLSGAPTSLGIGTYNVDVDAPSGLGFNTAMGQIDALIGGRVLKPTGIVANEGVIWTGTAWARGPAVTISAFASGPPAGAKDGDIWIGTGVDSNGTRWQFQYNASSASVFKWEFIGGAETITIDDGTVTTTSTTYAVPTAGTGAQLSYTVSRGGDYIVGHSGYMQASVAATFQVGIRATGSADLNLALSSATGATSYGAEKRMNGVTASGTIQPIVATSAGTATWAWRALWVRPVRVS